MARVSGAGVALARRVGRTLLMVPVLVGLLASTAAGPAGPSLPARLARLASLAGPAGSGASTGSGPAAAPAPGSLATGPGAGPSAPTPPVAPGYWMVAGDGGVFSFGGAAFHGSTGRIRLARPIVALQPTPTNNGYWLAAADGGVFTFGDARFLGSAARRPPGSPPVVAMASTPTGGGYWLFARDGGVSAFGDAGFFGSPPAAAVHAPVVAAAASPDGQGYWITAADGSVYPEGDAAVVGDASTVRLAAPIVGMAPTTSGRGYWLVAADGGVFTYGDAGYHGGAGALRLGQSVVAVTPSPSDGGYWLSAADGRVFSFGDAPYVGGAGNLHLARPVVSVRAPSPAHGSGVAIFYYPWYGNDQVDGAFRHWDEGGHTPPDDIGSDYYPEAGAYSSNDPAVLATQMTEIANAGINEVVVSWWGQGSFEDQALPGVVAAAKQHGIEVGIHLEPYGGRTPQSVASDYAYLGAAGIADVWVYMADLMPAPALAADNAAFPHLRTMAESGNVRAEKGGGFARWAAQARFAGVYLYDGVNFEAGDLPAFCAAARAANLVCAPVAAPGFVVDRATGAHYGRSRNNGLTYDSRWMGDLGARADLVAITSFNEWHEGTQIEPAVPRCLSATFCYLNYQGAYGATGLAADAYLARTDLWTTTLRATATASRS